MLKRFRRTLILSGIALPAWGLIVLLATLYILNVTNGPHANKYAAEQEYQSANSIFVKLFFSPIVEIFGWIVHHPEPITALATVFIGWFTWTLKESTNRLWEEAKASRAIAKQAADAAEHSVEIMRKQTQAEVGPS